MATWRRRVALGGIQAPTISPDELCGTGRAWSPWLYRRKSILGRASQYILCYQRPILLVSCKTTIVHLKRVRKDPLERASIGARQCPYLVPSRSRGGALEARASSGLFPFNHHPQ